MKRLMNDGWFQMFAAIAGLAGVISLLGTVTSHREQAAAPPPAAEQPVADPFKAAAAPAPAASALPAAPAPAAAPSAAVTALPAAPPKPAPAPDPPPKMTLTGTGVGNANGIVGGPPGGVAQRFMNMLRPPALQNNQNYANAPFGAAPQLVRPARPGHFEVDASGARDTTSLRDAAFSASDGDEILVMPGTYQGPVEVTGKKIMILGNGGDPGAVVIQHSGRGAAVMVRDGRLEMRNVRVLYGQANEFPNSEPHGALYSIASDVTLSKVELGSGGFSSPPLIAERGDKPSRLVIEDSYLMGARANAVLRGRITAKFNRTKFDHKDLPLVAWLEANVELSDCDFNKNGKPVVNAYEGASASLYGDRKARVDGTRGSEATGIEQLFGVKGTAGKSNFSRDIFRSGRKPGTLP